MVKMVKNVLIFIAPVAGGVKIGDVKRDLSAALPGAMTRCSSPLESIRDLYAPPKLEKKIAHKSRLLNQAANLLIEEELNYFESLVMNLYEEELIHVDMDIDTFLSASRFEKPYINHAKDFKDVIWMPKLYKTFQVMRDSWLFKCLLQSKNLKLQPASYYFEGLKKKTPGVQRDVLLLLSVLGEMERMELPFDLLCEQFRDMMTRLIEQYHSKGPNGFNQGGFDDQYESSGDDISPRKAFQNALNFTDEQKLKPYEWCDLFTVLRPVRKNLYNEFDTSKLRELFGLFAKRTTPSADDLRKLYTPQEEHQYSSAPHSSATH